jgi:hypothetical protein
VTLDFSRPGKPTDHPFIDSFNGSLRDEWLSVNWFLSLEDAKERSRRSRMIATASDRTAAVRLPRTKCSQGTSKI